jgi:hypothetical protein
VRSEGDPVQLADIVRTALPGPVVPGPITGIGGRCVAPEGGSSADGTALRLSACDGAPAQSWTPLPDRTLRNVKSALCLHAEGGATDGAHLLTPAPVEKPPNSSGSSPGSRSPYRP